MRLSACFFFVSQSPEDGAVTGTWEGVRVQAIATSPCKDVVYAADSHKRIRQYCFQEKSSSTLWVVLWGRGWGVGQHVWVLWAEYKSQFCCKWTTHTLLHQVPGGRGFGYMHHNWQCGVRASTWLSVMLASPNTTNSELQRNTENVHKAGTH